MLAFLGTLIGGPVVNGLLDAYRAKLAATNTADALAVDLAKKEIEADIAARAEATKVIMVEQGRWYTAIIRPLFAFPLVIYFWKIILWDKVLGFGTTDPLTGVVGEWAGIIIVAYFGGRSLEKVARVFARR
jgi:hypothetical protein